ncbi:MAG: lactonase family protein [Ruminococcaceae bacterium]|nr:lactonase family protein [Oscillospiraceae bacterium]
MSIPKGKTSYFGRFDDPEKFRLVPQKGVRIHVDPCDTHYPSCWDMNFAPSTGKLYFAPCDESGRNLHTRLVEYDWDTDTAKIAVKAELLTLPRERHMPHSKFHESITELPNGHIVATTHSTDRGKYQPEWMPFAHVDHVWDGFPGSYVIEYDPVSGKSWNLGCPAPRESIYGMTYDPKYNALYMIGFMKGHVYRMSLDDRTVKDLGKAAEVFCYRLHLGPDGHIYGMTKSGFLWRANVDTQELEDMNWRMPPARHAYVLNTWYRYMIKGKNFSDHEFAFTCGSSPNFYAFDTNTLTVRDLGKCMPFDYESDFMITPYSANEFGLDKEGVLWYVRAPSRYDFPTDEFYKTPHQLLLFRWDFQNGKKPECVGITGTQEEAFVRCTCMSLDPERDRIYCIGQLRPVEGYTTVQPSPVRQGLFMIDLAVMREELAKGEKGPIWKRDMSVIPMTEEEIAQVKEKALKYNAYAGEEVAGKNPVTATHISKVAPVRLWREIPGMDKLDSKVEKLVWIDENTIKGVCGNEKKYVFTIERSEYADYASREVMENDPDFWVYESVLKHNLEVTENADGTMRVKKPWAFNWKVTELKDYDEITVAEAKWLDANALPQPVDVPEDLKLPTVAGRQYLAKATASVKISDNRTVIGTKDGLLGIARYGQVFNLGNCAPQGPVRCLCTNADGSIVYGTAGDDEDMGTIFTYDDKNGLTQLGVVSFNSHGWMDGPTAAHILTSITLSPDGKYLAVGNADRLGCVHVFKIGKDA